MTDLTENRKFETLESRMNDIDHSLTERMNGISSRLGSLETFSHDQRLIEAVRAEREKNQEEKYLYLKKSLDEIKGYLLKLVWIIVLGILGSLLTFIVQGGLRIGS